MATSSSRSNCHVRSVSLPATSHPTTLCVQEELNKLKTWESPFPVTNVGNICYGLSKLEVLYKSVDNLLAYPITRQALSNHQNEKWVEELLDGSVKLMDICGSVRDIMSQIRQNTGEIQSALRRRKWDSSIETIIFNYVSFRKKIIKDAKRLIADLKQVENKLVASVPLLDQLREVITSSVSILQKLMVFLAEPVLKPKQSKWSIIFAKLKPEDEKVDGIVNELESLDAVICTLCKYGKTEGENVEIVRNRLETLDVYIKEIEVCVEGIFRRLIAMRASLLNIVSY